MDAGVWGENERICEIPNKDLTHKQLQYKNMYLRIEENFSSKRYMLPEKLQLYNEGKLIVNFNSLMTVLNVYQIVYDDVAKIA